MVYLLSILVGLLAAASAAIVAGFVASRYVVWYHVTGREGASGYFIIAMGLLGLIAGFIIGAVCGLSLGADTAVGFFKALGLSVLIVVVLSAIILGVCHALADIPPKINGHELFLIVEARLSQSRVAPSATKLGDAYVRFGSLSGHTLRKSERGQLWTEQAVFVEGRWIVPGAAKIFTSRGRRILEIHAGAELHSSFLVPLPAYPRKAQLAWSDWLPRRFPDGISTVDQMTYRFRVQRDFEPMYTETLGNFQITTYTSCFHEASDHGRQYVASTDAFSIGCHGTSVKFNAAHIASPVRMLIPLPGNPAALLANVLTEDGSYGLYLIQDVGDAVKVDVVTATYGIKPMLNALSGNDVEPPPHRSDSRLSIVRDGLYRVGLTTIFDTRTLASHQFSPTANTEVGDLLSLGLSPDERSFMRFAFDRETQAPLMTITDFVANQSYSLPIDRVRMRYVKIEDIDPAWAEHHFKWERDAEGVDQLVARTEFELLPYQGKLHHESETRSAYYLYGSNEAIGEVLCNVLIEKFGAQRQPPVEYQVDQKFLIGGAKVDVFASSDIASVTTEDARLAETIADALNAELATYKHDALFFIK